MLPVTINIMIDFIRTMTEKSMFLANHTSYSVYFVRKRSVVTFGSLKTLIMVMPRAFFANFFEREGDF